MFLLRRLFILLLLIGCLSLISFVLLWRNFVSIPLPVTKSEIIYVIPGSSIFSVAKMLESKGILQQPKLFIFFAHLQNKEKKLKAGEYKVDPGITPSQLLTNIVEGKVFLRHFTLVEGWNLKQVYSAINANQYLSHTIGQLTPLDLSKKVGSDRDNFEGYLYPDTYLFARGVSDVTILKKAFLSMQKNLKMLWPKRSQGLPYDDPYSALIVASLVEKETAQPSERSKVAGVIVRRLQKKMLLQIDAAVIYGLGTSYTGKITREDLKKDTPYNTYLHIGLPPTPIAMPSLASIDAALHPAAGTALYYVGRGDGTHEFTDNLEQHHAAVRKYHVSPLEDSETKFPLGDNYIHWFGELNAYQLNTFLSLPSESGNGELGDTKN